MAIIVDGENLNTPLFVDTYGFVDVSTADFDPLTTRRDWQNVAANMNISRLGNYRKKGFLARADEDGVLYAITLRQFKEAVKHPNGNTEVNILSTLVPEPITLTANQWLECRLIKVFAADSSAEWADSVSDLSIGTIL